MNLKQAKIHLRNLAKFGCLSYSDHFCKEMRECNATTEDVLNALMWGEIIGLTEDTEYQNYNCKVKGKDIEGQELVVVVGICLEENTISCITVW